MLKTIMKKSSDQKNQDPTTTPSPAFVVTRERFFVDEREHDDGVRTPLLEPSPTTSTSAINDEQNFNLTPFLRFASRYLLFSTFTSVHQKSSDLILDLRKSLPPSSAIHAPSPNLMDGSVPPVAKSASTTAFIKPRHLNSDDDDDDYATNNDNTSTNVLEQKTQATFIRTAGTASTTRMSQSMKDSKMHEEHSNSAGTTSTSTSTDEQEGEILLHKKRARATRMDEDEKLKKDLLQVKSFFRFSLFALQEFKRKIL